MAPTTFEVIVPTMNRPEKLTRCLDAIRVARGDRDLPVLVCDSSDDARHREVQEICARDEFVAVRRHHGRNVAAARNFCTQAAAADVLISIDDDVRVDPDGIAELIEAYERSPKPCAVAATVAWDGLYHEPVVMRKIGFGRPARRGEEPDFLVTAIFAYPRELGLTLPWNERIDTSDDVYIGALWRSHGVKLGFAPQSRGTHDEEHQHYPVDTQLSHIYVNLFMAVHARPDLVRALCFEFVGFAAGARLYCRTPSSAARYAFAWLRGNLRFLRDSRYLRQMVRRPLPDSLLA